MRAKSDSTVHRRPYNPAPVAASATSDDRLVKIAISVSPSRVGVSSRSTILRAMSFSSSSFKVTACSSTSPLSVRPRCRSVPDDVTGMFA
jgi:hypothetical protein